MPALVATGTRLVPSRTHGAETTVFTFQRGLPVADNDRISTVTRACSTVAGRRRNDAADQAAVFLADSLLARRVRPGMLCRWRKC